MKNKSVIFVTVVFMTIIFKGNAQTDYLVKSWIKQVKPIKNKYLTFSFKEELNELEHSFYPWQQTNYNVNGQIWANNAEFIKIDTLNGKHNSKTSISRDEMLLLDFGNTKLSVVTEKMFKDQTFKTGKYVPTRILDYFKSKNISIDDDSDEQFAIYKTVINKTVIRLYINKSNNLLAKITTLNDDEFFGDVLTSYTYSNYVKIKGFNLALDIKIEKINGKLIDKINLTNPIITQISPEPLERPNDYFMANEKTIKPNIKIEKYNDRIYFVELKHTNDRVMIVEFVDFLLVAEAPLNSENGELIIQEARKIAPDKPIKYFVFGHHHPHYLGGIRPFVHKAAKIISLKQNEEYVSYIVKAKHTLNPDKLQLDPKPLMFEEIKDSLTISDNRMKMVIFFIGKKSKHTNDYLIYYFPEEKILFQDDLVWISKEGKIKKAGEKQEGLYNAIVNLGIEPKIIIQSWPVSNYGVKTVIPFEELKKSVFSE